MTAEQIGGTWRARLNDLHNLAERIERWVDDVAGAQDTCPLVFPDMDANVARIRSALARTETTVHPRPTA